MAIVPRSSISDAGNMSRIWLYFMYTLNRKSTKKNSKENKARLELVRQYSKRVAKHSNISAESYLNPVLISASKSFKVLLKILKTALVIQRGAFENLPHI